jgi:hypothetical protein
LFITNLDVAESKIHKVSQDSPIFTRLPVSIGRDDVLRRSGRLKRNR